MSKGQLCHLVYVLMLLCRCRSLCLGKIAECHSIFTQIHIISYLNTYHSLLKYTSQFTQIPIIIYSTTYHNLLKNTSQFTQIHITVYSNTHHNLFKYTLQSTKIHTTIYSNIHYSLLKVHITIYSDTHHNLLKYTSTQICICMSTERYNLALLKSRDLDNLVNLHSLMRIFAAHIKVIHCKAYISSFYTLINQHGYGSLCIWFNNTNNRGYI